jgi:hypothetical protein
MSRGWILRRLKELSVKKQVMVSGDHGIGQIGHVVHMFDDAQELRGFYERVFGFRVHRCRRSELPSRGGPVRDAVDGRRPVRRDDGAEKAG